MVKLVTIFLCKNTQMLNPWAGGDSTFSILSDLQLDSQYENQRQWQQTVGAILFRISKHRIGFRIYSLPHAIQTYCYCMLIVCRPKRKQKLHAQLVMNYLLEERESYYWRKQKSAAAFTLIQQLRVSFCFILLNDFDRRVAFWMSSITTVRMKAS
jgi:hypothetical protein